MPAEEGDGCLVHGPEGQLNSGGREGADGGWVGGWRSADAKGWWSCSSAWRKKQSWGKMKAESPVTTAEGPGSLTGAPGCSEPSRNKRPHLPPELS